jgi:LSD1 subclass zinc finger protein
MLFFPFSTSIFLEILSYIIFLRILSGGTNIGFYAVSTPLNESFTFYNVSVRIKKFSCINCGGPKINDYVLPYIMCDFCGSFTDIDFAVGMDKWSESALTTVNYQFRKMQLMHQAQTALGLGDRGGYYKLQHEFWDFYYRSFPAYLPPTIDTPNKYRLYLEICAESSTESAFDQKWQDYGARQQQLQSAVQYRIVGLDRKAETSSFFALTEFFMWIMKEGMRGFYENPRYAIMHELLPENVHLKMKMSMFVQAWLPYLTDEDAGRLLKMLGFSNEYVEMARPNGHTIDCSTCKAILFAPEGSYRVFCERCRKTTPISTGFYCMSCGAPNDVPENPGLPIDCRRCGTTNRLIRPLLG